MAIKITQTNEEIILSKFLKTLEVLNGYIQEANGDMDRNITYDAKIVRNRIVAVKIAFLNDVSNMAGSVTTD